MAEQQQQHGGVLDLDRFCCSVCLDLLKDPVAIHCGHVYCRICIEGCWDQEEEKGVFSCPQCRESFSPRPVLGRNNMLAEVMENLKTTGSQQASPSAALVYAGPADVACDFCTGTRRHKAVMSCLTCMVSYCETHLQPHYSVPVLQKHKLVSATARLQEETCSIHDKLMEVYCRTDQQCVCYLCILDEHKGHNTVSVAAERAEKQKQLGVSQQEVQKRIQERERELKELSQAVKDLKSSAQTAVQACDTIFTELICSIERRCSEVKQLITAQEKTAVSQAEELLLQLEKEIARLRRRDTEMEELSHTDHHYLDHEAGTLSFYNVSDTMTLLHKVCTTFTQSLYPGINLYSPDGAFAELMKLCVLSATLSMEEEQLKSHQAKLKHVSTELAELRSYPPDKKVKAKEIDEYKLKEHYLEFEINLMISLSLQENRYEMYVKLLREGLKDLLAGNNGEAVLKKSQSSPSLNQEQGQPPTAKIKRNTSERKDRPDSPKVP
ncbi:E3 ubiquitin/ISG15 ligase TRIM25-like [Diretmus argenteus]